VPSFHEMAKEEKRVRSPHDRVTVIRLPMDGKSGRLPRTLLPIRMFRVKTSKATRTYTLFSVDDLDARKRGVVVLKGEAERGDRETR
jgi:hypothetical protein